MKQKNDAIFQTIVYILTVLICLITVYPLIYVVSASFSDPARILGGDVVLWPVDITLNAYKRVFSSSDILTGYRNTVVYTFFGTIVNMFFTIICAYPLSLPDLKGKNAITIFITFTMFFGAGMIPEYLNIKSLGLLNNPLVLIIPGAISVTNMLIMRNYFINSVPAALREAADIDGATRFQKAVYITLPSLLPTAAVLLIMNSGWILNSSLDMFMVFQNTTNMETMEVLDMYIYKYGLKSGNYSVSTALGLVRGLIALALTLGVNQISKKVNDVSIV